ncbi:UNVERIFIED_CONTAM: hypothetical protein PYX00_006612 [Menopon gallinae]|uniref:Lysosomal dipeptide transporter MFSD1 n=1 Tax=Menopon gallinae TaxID=328185 RepID=A0AAW2HXC4_9NEOP
MDDSEENQPESDNLNGTDAGKKGLSCCDTQSLLYRLLGLMCMCLLGFGSYFCYDGPGALREHFESDMNLKTSQFVLLYAWYSWPSVVLCFIGGFLIDRVFGIRLGTSIFAGLVVLGQLVFALGAVFNAFWLLIVGRFIFGIGAESLAVAQNYYAVLWFKGKELNMVFGFQLSFARLGSTVNFMVMEPIYTWVGQYYKGHMCTAISLFIAGSTCIVSFVCAIILAWMDKKYEKTSKRASSQNSSEVISLKDVKDFPATFWMISIICVAYYAAIFPFVALGKVFFERKFDFDPNAANQVNSFVYLISILTSPIMGLLVDKTGRNVFWVFISILFSIGSHSILAFTFLNPFIGTSALGVAYSMLASALWPMVAIVIPEYQLGTAYGITQSVQNLGLAVITMMTGSIVDNGGYLLLEVFFLAWLCVSLITIIIIWIYDSLKSGVLNMSVKEREIYEANKLAGDVLEREKLLASGSMSDNPPHNMSQPQSDFHIRNRYLSRIGATLPSHYNGMTRNPPYRALR